jgi:hypothetical protein
VPDPHRHTINASAATTPLVDAITGLTSIWSITSRRSCASSDSRQMVSTSAVDIHAWLAAEALQQRMALQGRQHHAQVPIAGRWCDQPVNIRTRLATTLAADSLSGKPHARGARRLAAGLRFDHDPAKPRRDSGPN